MWTVTVCFDEIQAPTGPLLTFLKLELDDDSKTIVARSHRSDIGIIGGKPRQARLEICPGFEHLIDVILVTYIFAEKLRKDREKATEKRIV
jgi:hypothetical protein